MKELLAAVLSWVAFLSAVMIINVPIYLIVCSKCDMFESKSLYYRVTNGYFDFLATLPGNGLWLFFGLAPAIWHSSYGQEVPESRHGSVSVIR